MRFRRLERAGQLPTLHEVRALSSHLYAKAGYRDLDVQDLTAHTDPDMTRAYQKGRARKVLRVEVMLPFSVSDNNRSERPGHLCDSNAGCGLEKISKNFLRKNGVKAQASEK